MTCPHRPASHKKIAIHLAQLHQDSVACKEGLWSEEKGPGRQHSRETQTDQTDSRFAEIGLVAVGRASGCTAVAVGVNAAAGCIS